MRKIFLLLLSVLALGCESEESVPITVAFPKETLWEYEYGSSFWYSLEYFDGEDVKSRFVFSGEKEVTVYVHPESTCVFSARALSSLNAIGGGYSPGDEGPVSLKRDEGIAASVLIDSVAYARDFVREINYKSFIAAIPKHVNEDKLYAAILDGSFTGKSVSAYPKSFSISLDGLKGGRWIGESDEDETFIVENGESKTLSLCPGIHWFLNVESKIGRMVAVYEDGKSEFREYRIDF